MTDVVVILAPLVTIGIAPGSRKKVDTQGWGDRIGKVGRPDGGYPAFLLAAFALAQLLTPQGVGGSISPWFGVVMARSSRLSSPDGRSSQGPPSREAPP